MITVDRETRIPSDLSPHFIKRSRSGGYQGDCTDDKLKKLTFSFLCQPIEWKILSLLSFKELKSISVVCQSWYKYANNPWLQKQIMLNEFPVAAKALSVMSATIDWNCTYRNHSQLPRYVKQVCNIPGACITSVQAVGNRYLIGTSNSIYVKVVDGIGNLVDERILKHTGSMNAFVVKENILVSGNGPEARVWDLTTGACTRTVTSFHTKDIKSLTLSGSTIVSGALDGTLCTWNVDSTAPATLIGRQAGGIYSLKIRQLAETVQVFCGSDQGELNVFNLNGTESTSFNAKYKNSISALDIHDHRLVVGTFDKKGTTKSQVHVWDLTTLKETQSFIPTEGFLRTLCLADGNRLVTGNSGSFRMWDLTKKNSTKRDVIKEFPLSSKEAIPYAMSITQLGFLIGGSDGSVREFCYSP